MFSYEVISSERRSVVTGAGRIVADDAVGAMGALAEDALFDPTYDVIIDLRSIDYVSSVDDIWRLTGALTKLHGSYQGRIALLVRGDRYRYLADLMCEIVTTAGMRMAVFDDHDAATAWLGGV